MRACTATYAIEVVGAARYQIVEKDFSTDRGNVFRLDDSTFSSPLKTELKIAHFFMRSMLLDSDVYTFKHGVHFLIYLECHPKARELGESAKWFSVSFTNFPPCEISCRMEK